MKFFTEVDMIKLAIFIHELFTIEPQSIGDYSPEYIDTPDTISAYTLCKRAHYFRMAQDRYRRAELASRYDEDRDLHAENTFADMEEHKAQLFGALDLYYRAGGTRDEAVAIVPQFIHSLDSYLISKLPRHTPRTVIIDRRTHL